MLHPKQHITDLAEICKRKGLNRVVISPGSRSAPLINAFLEALGENCVSIVDERSAAYYALGIAIYTQKPVALICTSGTALLNYAPALAEAFYQQVPLLAITADRPNQWIGQLENQTIRQTGIYNNFVKGSYDLPLTVSSGDDLWFVHRTVNEAFDLCLFPGKGPVHINLPLQEPLYDELPPPSEKIRIIDRMHPQITLKLPEDLVTVWSNARRIMIVHGQDNPDAELAQILSSLSNDGRIIILAENIANIKGAHTLSNSNQILSVNRGNNPDYPDLILHSGGQVVSKALTSYLRRAVNVRCWRIGIDNGIIDTFKQVSGYVPYPPASVYRQLAEKNPVISANSYRDMWLAMDTKTQDRTKKSLMQLPFSDAHVFSYILKLIPEGALLVLGNSSVIRYSQVFPARESQYYYSNRGVSGIDGCLSSAAGIAYASGKLTIAITGDLGFLYDSNALWNRDLPVNLRILVINNSGGGIFHILKGASEQPGFKKFIEAHHPVNIHKLAEAYGLNYLVADNETSLAAHWEEFTEDLVRPVVFEVKTDAAISASIFKKLMNSME
jgi:2-succinyl-5-enolpyruvyl-6-hydroxy-3-cyclohexene-1-carboxylate synthase